MHFSPSQWDRIKSSSRAWWEGSLGRPLVVCRLGGGTPNREPAQHPFREYTALYDLDVSAEAVVDAWDYHLAGETWHGDGFPQVWPNFGPGVLAAFLGAELQAQAETQTVWFHPVEEKPIADLHFEYQPGNSWVERIKDILRAAGERWQGEVQVGMTDLGGALDVLSSFRPSEKLLLDLIDYPDEVKRCIGELHDLWFRYFEEIQEVLAPTNPGWSAWPGFFSPEPHYMLQCDFCYMISPDMFDEFVKPDLAAACKRLADPFYHLDGPGQLAHLDSLLTIPELKGVQWIPGDGQPTVDHWPEVYEKILAAGKLAQTYGGPEVLESLADQLGNVDRILHIARGTQDDLPAWQRVFDRFGIDG